MALDSRGKTAVQPDGSHRDTPVRKGGNYKRHWSQVKTKGRGKKRAAGRK